MKKLLLIGAMLIVGAMSFSASVTVLEKGDSDKYSGTGLLDVHSTGKILDPTGRAMLVINPKNNAGPDGESLLFDFGAVGRGTEVKQVGSFEAEVITKKGDEIVKSNLSDSNIKIKLLGPSDKMTDDGKKITNFPVMSLISANKKLVNLSYQLSGSNGITNGGKTYSGEIMATAYRPLKTQDKSNEYIAGRFDDKSVSLEVTVTDVIVSVQAR